MNDATASGGGTCLRCGYDLTGLDDRRPCPECGLLAGFSRVGGERLDENRPRWLRRLAGGCGLLAGAMLLGPMAAGGLALLALWHGTYIQGVGRPAPEGVFALVPQSRATHLAVGTASLILPAMLAAAGTLLLAARSGRSDNDARDRRRRIALRVAAALLLLAVAFYVAACFGATPDFLFSRSIITLVATLLSTFAACGLVAAAVAYSLRPLAERAPAPLLAADSPVVGYTLAGCFALPGALGVVGVTAGLPDPVVDLWFAFLAVFPAVAATLYLWSIYLLIRYAVAFASSARQARAAFDAADAAGGPSPSDR